MTTPTGAVGWAPAPGVLWHRCGPVVVVLGPDDEAPIVLEGTAAAAWAVLEHGVAIDELVTTLAETFDTDADRVAVDVAPLLDGFRRRRVVAPTG